MKRILSIAAPLLLVSSLAFAAGESGTVKVRVQKLRNDKGTIRCSLWNKDNGFPTKHQNSLVEASAKPKDGAAELIFEKVDAATIAIACMHDENDNEKLETNFLGIPKEGTAASNDAKGKMGAPTFDAAKFPFTGGTKEVVLTMGY